jgi:two-component system KDP operon response regulator KdpE
VSAAIKGKASILVIDDERQIRRLLQLTLESADFAVQLANTGEEGLIRAGTDHPNLVILDLGLPDMDGMEVLKKLRAWAQFPILILSVRDSEHEIITALDSGADDYLTKPFRSGELLARIRTALRHRSAATDDGAPFTLGSLWVDLGARVVKKNSEVVKLTSIEFSLLGLFVRNAGRVLTHRYILEQVWGHAYAEETQYSRVYVAALRKKLEDDPSHPRLILTESGIGYRLDAG